MTNREKSIEEFRTHAANLPSDLMGNKQDREKLIKILTSLFEQAYDLVNDIELVHVGMPLGPQQAAHALSIATYNGVLANFTDRMQEEAENATSKVQGH